MKTKTQNAIITRLEFWITKTIPFTRISDVLYEVYGLEYGKNLRVIFLHQIEKSSFIIHTSMYPNLRSELWGGGSVGFVNDRSPMPQITNVPGHSCPKSYPYPRSPMPPGHTHAQGHQCPRSPMPWVTNAIGHSFSRSSLP